MNWLEELRYALAAEHVADGTNQEYYRDLAVFLVLDEWNKRLGD